MFDTVLTDELLLVKVDFQIILVSGNTGSLPETMHSESQLFLGHIAGLVKVDTGRNIRFHFDDCRRQVDSFIPVYHVIKPLYYRAKQKGKNCLLFRSFTSNSAAHIICIKWLRWMVYPMLTQCYLNVGPPPATLAHH